MGAHHWGSNENIEGEGLATASTTAKLVSACSTKVAIPTSPFAHLQNYISANFDQGTCWGADLSGSNLQMRNFTSLRARFAHTKEMN